MGKRLTPLQSARAYCLWCCCGSALEGKLCSATHCALHRFRLGKGNISVKDIHARCIDCSGDKLGNVKDCEFGKPLPNTKSDNYPCALHLYRMGTNPNVKGNPNIAKQGFSKRTETPTA